MAAKRDNRKSRGGKSGDGSGETAWGLAEAAENIPAIGEKRTSSGWLWKMLLKVLNNVTWDGTTDVLDRIKLRHFRFWEWT